MTNEHLFSNATRKENAISSRFNLSNFAQFFPLIIDFYVKQERFFFSYSYYKGIYQNTPNSSALHLTHTSPVSLPNGYYVYERMKTNIKVISKPLIPLKCISILYFPLVDYTLIRIYAD